MLNQVLMIPRRRRRAVAVAAASTVVADLGNWDRIEGKLGAVSVRVTKPSGSAADQVLLSILVGEQTPADSELISVERSAGSGPQIEDPVYKAVGVRGNRIQISFRNTDTVNSVTVTFDVEVLNRG